MRVRRSPEFLSVHELFAAREIVVGPLGMTLASSPVAIKLIRFKLNISSKFLSCELRFVPFSRARSQPLLSRTKLVLLGLLFATGSPAKSRGSGFIVG